MNIELKGMRQSYLKVMLLGLIGSALLTACTQKSFDASDIRYDVSFPNAAHNEAEVSLQLSGLSSVPVHISMSRSSPGRYALHEFAKNIYNVRATDSKGDTLEITRPDLHNWIISGHDGSLTFSYTLYGDHADGTYNGINRQHAHLNIPATFAWVRGLEARPMTVRFHPPEGSGWKAATQLKPAEDPMTFTAPNLSYFMDSPVELSDFSRRTWQVSSDTTTYTIRLDLHHNGTEAQLDTFADMAKKVVAEQIGIYGEPAPYDFGTYTFIADYLPYVYGDGMEHRNSTILTSTRPLGDNPLRNLYTLSHEFFHSWNVERIRPKDLKPFDFTRADMSKALWFAEGFTNYYDDLMIRRAGLIDNKTYTAGWNGTLNYVLHSPGSSFYNPIQMSMQAPFVDAATSVDAQNKSNTFISYYSWGSVLGMGLDLMLRSTFDDITLDDYMRAMWQKYGKPEKAYTIDDLQNTLAEVTDSTAFADHYFQQYIYKGKMIDFKPLFAKAGFLLRKEFPGQAVMSLGGNKISFQSGKAEVASNTTIGSPLYKAGADRGDTLVSLDGKPISSAKDIQRVLAAHKPGDNIAIVFKSLGETYSKTLVLTENPTLELVPYEQANLEVTPAMKTFRENWLGSKAMN